MSETHGSRIIYKATYNKEDDELPPFFECQSPLIFEFNTIHFNGMREDIEALFSRGDYVNLVMSFEQVKDIMFQIAKTEEEKEITQFLLDNYSYAGLNMLNLRTQQKAFKIAEYSKRQGKDWKTELMLFMKSEITYARKLLYSFMGDRIIKTSDLKKLLVRSGLDGIYYLRTADRRIREWVELGELKIAGLETDNEDEVEAYMNNHRNFAVCLI
jgi:hypothetical protein